MIIVSVDNSLAFPEIEAGGALQNRNRLPVFS